MKKIKLKTTFKRFSQLLWQLISKPAVHKHIARHSSIRNYI